MSVANAGEAVFEGYTYDPRQTDNAWVESRAYLVQLEGDALPSTFTPGGDFDEVKWWPLEAGTINRLPPGQARFLRECVAKLVESEQMETSQGEELLAATG